MSHSEMSDIRPSHYGLWTLYNRLQAGAGSRLQAGAHLWQDGAITNSLNKQTTGEANTVFFICNWNPTCKKLKACPNACLDQILISNSLWDMMECRLQESRLKEEVAVVPGNRLDQAKGSVHHGGRAGDAALSRCVSTGRPTSTNCWQQIWDSENIHFLVTRL